MSPAKLQEIMREPGNPAELFGGGWRRKLVRPIALVVVVATSVLVCHRLFPLMRSFYWDFGINAAVYLAFDRVFAVFDKRRTSSQS